MICEESIATMKDGVRILNFSRGALVASKDIIKALESGKVAAYVTDFPSDDVIGVDGVIAIPHLGASTPESEDNCAFMAANEIIGFLENGSIKNSVNMPNVELGDVTGGRICVIHKNVPNLLTSITGVVSAANINIENMVNKSRGDYAYSVIDTADKNLRDVVAKITDITDVVKAWSL